PIPRWRWERDPAGEFHLCVFRLNAEQTPRHGPRLSGRGRARSRYPADPGALANSRSSDCSEFVDSNDCNSAAARPDARLVIQGETNMLPPTSALRPQDGRWPRERPQTTLRCARLCLEELEPRTAPSVTPTLSVGANVNTGHMAGSQSEPAIAINPTNPNQ